MVKKRANKKENNFKKIERKAKMHDKMAVVFFLIMSYLSVNFFNEIWYNYLFGILFLISGLYGLISLYKGKRFIFKR